MFKTGSYLKFPTDFHHNDTNNHLDLALYYSDNRAAIYPPSSINLMYFCIHVNAWQTSGWFFIFRSQHEEFTQEAHLRSC